MRRLVIDASVLLAAPLGRPEGSPSLLVEAAKSGAVEIACETLFGEFQRGLVGRYFRDRVSEEECKPPAMSAHEACAQLGLLAP